MTTTRKYIRNPYGPGYQSADSKWLIQSEGSSNCWYAVELGEDTFPIDETKSYWRSVKECKNYITWVEENENQTSGSIIEITNSITDGFSVKVTQATFITTDANETLAIPSAWKI